ncbi:MAG: hypothetical protein ACI3XJ_11495 [Oscillospiraceae bacterium]
MTDNELRKLSRSDLLELLIAQSREMDQLREQLQQMEEQLRQTEEQLKCRQIELNEAGSLAEASLQLNGIFQAAQDAASQYLENIQRLSGHQREICARMERETRRTGELMLAETREKCRKMEEETRAECRKLLESAKRESQVSRGETECSPEEPRAARKESMDFYAVRIGKDTEA